MIKATLKASLLITLSLTIGVLIGLGIRSLAHAEAPARVINVSEQVILAERPSNVQTLNEVVITVPARKAFKKAPKKDKNLLCGSWEESKVGGSYRRCDWK